MSQPAHLLSLAALHTAAPVSLDVVFGLDGDFEEAPTFRPKVWMDFENPLFGPPEVHQMDFLDPDDNGVWISCNGGEGRIHLSACFLDLRVPSVAARLAGLCARSIPEDATATEQVRWLIDDALHAGHLGRMWTANKAARLAALTLALAPRIAALKPTA